MKWAPWLGALAALVLATGCGGGGLPPGAPLGTTLPELAAQGDAEAQVSLGWMYETGQGYERSYGRAARWYRRAADQGSTLAQYALGELYAGGRGVDQDYRAAAAWYRAAAEGGNVSAQLRLAYLYENGLGVPRDYAAAAAWYGRARQDSLALGSPPPGLARIIGAGPATPVLIPPPREAPVADAGTDGANAPATGETMAAQAAQPAGVWVHVASFRTANPARAHWKALKGAHADLLDALGGDLVRVDLGADLGVWMRLRAGPLPGIAAAEALCRALRARDLYCAPLAP